VAAGAEDASQGGDEGGGAASPECSGPQPVVWDAKAPPLRPPSALRAGSPLGPRASDAGPPQDEKRAVLVAMLRNGAAPLEQSAPAPQPAHLRAARAGVAAREGGG